MLYASVMTCSNIDKLEHMFFYRYQYLRLSARLCSIFPFLLPNLFFMIVYATNNFPKFDEKQIIQDL